MPFYSILIPTKNRSHLIGNAILSVLRQSYRDFEIVVCDNDDNEENNATFTSVQKYNDHRIKYIRTGGIDMVANWNTALRAATGEYISVLEDKMILYPNALKEIKYKIDRSSSGVVVWNSDIFDDNHNPSRLVQYTSTGESNINSKDILKLVTEDVLNNWNKLPRGLSCVIPSYVIKEIISNTAAEYFEAMSPDFVSALKILDHVNEILMVYKAYTLVTSASASTGNNALTGNNTALKYYSGSKIANLSVEYVPVKNSSIVVNCIINDFRKIAAKNNGSIKGCIISNKYYIYMMTRDLIVSTFMTKKLLWDRATLLQLINSEGMVLRNIFNMFVYTSKFISINLLSKLGLVNSDQKRKVSLIKGNSLEKLSLFLSGEEDLGIVKSFPKVHNRLST